MSERQPPRPEPAPKSNSLHPQPETAANLPLAKSPTEPRIFSAGTPSEQPPDNPLPADFDPVLEPPQLPELEQSGVLFEPGSGIRKPDFDRWPEIKGQQVTEFGVPPLSQPSHALEARLSVCGLLLFLEGLGQYGGRSPYLLNPATNVLIFSRPLE